MFQNINTKMYCYILSCSTIQIYWGEFKKYSNNKHALVIKRFIHNNLLLECAPLQN